MFNFMVKYIVLLHSFKVGIRYKQNDLSIFDLNKQRPKSISLSNVANILYWQNIA